MLRKTKLYQKAFERFWAHWLPDQHPCRNCERPTARWQPTASRIATRQSIPGIGYLYVCPNTYHNCTMASCIL